MHSQRDFGPRDRMAAREWRRGERSGRGARAKQSTREPSRPATRADARSSRAPFACAPSIARCAPLCVLLPRVGLCFRRVMAESDGRVSTMHSHTCSGVLAEADRLAIQRQIASDPLSTTVLVFPSLRLAGPSRHSISIAASTAPSFARNAVQCTIRRWETILTMWEARRWRAQRTDLPAPAANRRPAVAVAQTPVRLVFPEHPWL